MNTKKNLLKLVLRVLTPAEINELTTTYGGRKQVALTDIIECGLNNEDWRKKFNPDGDELEHEAKILPFNQEVEVAVDGEELSVSTPELCGEKIKILLQGFYEECLRMEKNILGPKRPVRKNIPGLRKELSSFIIEEKKKFEVSYIKLKSKEILTLYKKNAVVDIEYQKKSKDDLSKSSQFGVLVDKKQA